MGGGRAGDQKIRMDTGRFAFGEKVLSPEQLENVGVQKVGKRTLDRGKT